MRVYTYLSEPFNKALPAKSFSYLHSNVPDGYASYVSVNDFESVKGKGVLPNETRTEDKLTAINSVYVEVDWGDGKDTDGNKPDFVSFWESITDRLEPTRINETKNGYHVYWDFTTPVKPTDDNKKIAKGVIQTLINEYKGDSGAKDLARILRVVGSVHRKDPANPFTIKSVWSGGETYTLDEIVTAFPPTYKEVVATGVAGKLTIDASAALEKMLSKPHIAQLWAGDIDESKKSESDLSLCNYLAFWLQKDPIEMEKAWLSSPLGDREKTQSRKDYRDRVINCAIEGTTDIYTPREVVVKESVEDISLDALMSVKKKDLIIYLTNDENIIRILSHYNVAKYDTFRNRAFLLLDGKWKVRDDGSDGELYSWLVKKFPFLATIPSRKVAELLTVVQYRHSFDSAIDYVNGLSWDGEARLDDWLNKVFYVGTEQYHKDIGSKWWMGMVGRILTPGSKFDNVLIIQGGQRVGKSSAFLAIAGDNNNHVEFTDLHVKEMQQDIQGKMIVEFAEAAIFSKADSESLKSIVSRQTDTFRVPYERHARDFPRRCVFGVTANNDDILKDATGGRRWWVVDLPDDMKQYPPKRVADVDWLKENRDQLFAEAAVRYRSGEQYWDINDEELFKHQQSIIATEQDEELFFDWYNCIGADMQNAGVSIREAYCGAYKIDFRGDPLRVDTVSIKKADEMRVGRILKKLGLEKKKIHGGLVRWYPGEKFDRNYQQVIKKTVHEEKW